MVRYLLTSLLLVIMGATGNSQPGFKETQQSYARVRNAYRDKWDPIKDLIAEQQVEAEKLQICIRAFKQEQLLEVWIKDKDQETFSMLRSYEICATSGVAGPKRREGDMQIPEGFYHIQVFNPWSTFHLSLGIDYPNLSDRVLGKGDRLGGDIYIHGSCVTIGCIPLTDDLIKEVYVLCVEARNNGQEKIPITIYPAKMTRNNYMVLANSYGHDMDRLNLWEDLKTAYDLFERDKRNPNVTYLEDGRHLISVGEQELDHYVN